MTSRDEYFQKAEQLLYSLIEERECKDGNLRDLIRARDAAALTKWCENPCDPVLVAPIQIFISGIHMQDCFDGLHQAVESQSTLKDSLLEVFKSKYWH